MRHETYYQKHRDHLLEQAKARYAAKRGGMGWKALRAWDAWRRRHAPVEIAHCNTWHAVAALPWHCPTCGYTLGGSHDSLPLLS